MEDQSYRLISASVNPCTPSRREVLGLPRGLLAFLSASLSSVSLLELDDRDLLVRFLRATEASESLPWYVICNRVNQN